MKKIFLIVMMFNLVACSVHKLNGDSVDRDTILSSLVCSNSTNLLEQTSSASMLYENMKLCVVTENYSSAVMLFALAGTTSWYDAARTEDAQIKQQHVTLLKNSLQGLTTEQKDGFWKNVQIQLGTPETLNKICEKIAIIGPPKLQSNYLDSANVAWSDALTNYLHCPASF